jgi:sec-independent protein translocase protein TatA
MGAFGIWQWVIVLVIVLVLFGGRGKISQLMGDFGKGLKSFKKGMNEDEPAREGEKQKLDTPTSEMSDATTENEKH